MPSCNFWETLFFYISIQWQNKCFALQIWGKQRRFHRNICTMFQECTHSNAKVCRKCQIRTKVKTKFKKKSYIFTSIARLKPTFQILSAKKYVDLQKHFNFQLHNWNSILCPPTDICTPRPCTRITPWRDVCLICTTNTTTHPSDDAPGARASRASPTMRRTPEKRKVTRETENGVLCRRHAVVYM